MAKKKSLTGEPGVVGPGGVGGLGAVELGVTMLMDRFSGELVDVDNGSNGGASGLEIVGSREAIGGLGIGNLATIDVSTYSVVQKERNASRNNGLAFVWGESRISHTRTRFHERTQIKIKDHPALNVLTHERKVTAIDQPYIQSIIQEGGLADLVRCSHSIADKGLLSAFAERWHRDTLI
ncbi:hypothetical protein VNO77_23089 [Canavalia gladiata]|uniref:Uncharacterized protein n=1 Tax=Canavalia gladiata TaxID=3824 RepID=A0AAN9L4Q9_CANGL